MSTLTIPGHPVEAVPNAHPVQSQSQDLSEAIKTTLAAIDEEKKAAAKAKHPQKKDQRNVGVIAFEGTTMSCDTLPIYFQVNTGGISDTVEHIIDFYSERINNEDTKIVFGECFRYAFVSNLHRYLVEVLSPVRNLPYENPIRWFQLPHVAFRLITSLSSYSVRSSGLPRIYPEAAHIEAGIENDLGVDRLDNDALRTVLGRWDNLVLMVSRDKPSCWYDKPNKDDDSLLVCGAFKVDGPHPEYYSVSPFKLTRSDELLCAMMRLRRFHKRGVFYEPEFTDDEEDALPQLLSYFCSTRPIDLRHFLNEYLASELRDG